MDSEALAIYLGRWCPRVRGLLASLPADRRDALISEILDTCNAETTAIRLEDLLGGEGTGEVHRVLEDPGLRRAFFSTIAGSGFLFSILRRRPQLIDQVFLDKAFLIPKTRQAKQEELRERVRSARSPVELGRELRRYKDEEYLRIGCRDLAGLADVQEVTGELSDLAAASIEIALDVHWDWHVARHGSPRATDGGKGLVVMGMGKIAGGELNFSSDVDLMFLREPEDALTQGPDSVPVARFYESLTLAVTHSLSEVTEDGFAFRVDLRLRPEGEKGELVPSAANALNYYLGWGRTWERAALMKAVPLAGDLGLGKVFVKALEPFVFRKYLDYSTLEEMRELKRRIEAQLRTKPGIDIKLGQGGIRAIEFFVQTLQLINGGRNPRVRAPGTLEALDRFRETGLLAQETADGLREAYIFFRKTEHRIQINHQLQTHKLPRTDKEQEELARKMGYTEHPLEAFRADLERRRFFVDKLFSSLLAAPGDEILAQCSSEVRTIVAAIDSEEKTVGLLSAAGFENASAIYEVLKELLAPSAALAPSEKARLLLQRLTPLFLDEALKDPEPDNALMALDKYLRSVKASSTYFSTLLENPPTARFLVRILGESRFFSELLTRHPQSIDSLIGRWALQHTAGKVSLERTLSEHLASSEDYEAQLDRLRIFKNERILQIGASHLSGEIDSSSARRLITELAEVCLRAATDVAAREMERKFGDVGLNRPLPFVILGMGKLGGLEMTYLSDVDVIFIYDPPSDMIGRFSSHEWFTRLASRIISVLSIPTSEGVAFAIDTRLRPSGEKGLLVVTLSSFREYHRTTSKLWEKQALIKARPVAGSPDLGQGVLRITRDCVMRTLMSTEDLGEIDRLRKRMEAEIALEDSRHVDLKTGHGGLVDVEFYVQGKILMHGGQYPQVLQQNTLDALDALKDAGLVDNRSYWTLNQGYRFLTNLEDRLRIMEHRSVDRMALEGEKLRGLAQRLGYAVGEEHLFISDYFNVTDSIRGIYRSFFGVT